MKAIGLACLPVVFALTGAGSVGAEDKAAPCRELLDKATKAMGGEAALAPLQAAYFRTKGSFLFLDRIETAFTDEWFVDGERYRIYVNLEVKDLQVEESLVLNGDKGWLWESQAKRTVDLPPVMVTAARESLYAFRLLHRLPALKSKPFELSPLEEIKIKDRLAVGMKVVQKGHPEVRLYFDRETALPIKSEVRLREYDIQAATAGQVANYAFYFAEYKDFLGLRHFSKITLEREGKHFYQSTVVEISPTGRLNAILFDRP